jgi:hypothetical protein
VPPFIIFPWYLDLSSLCVPQEVSSPCFLVFLGILTYPSIYPRQFVSTVRRHAFSWRHDLSLCLRSTGSELPSLSCLLSAFLLIPPFCALQEVSVPRCLAFGWSRDVSFLL